VLIEALYGGKASQFIETEVKFEDGRRGKVSADLQIATRRPCPSSKKQPEETLTMSGRQIGDVILDLQNISLRFGGVKALTDISFDVREHEVRAIIGPNGAGKSSMLNVINGVYQPQEGRITFHGRERRKMEPHMAAMQGIARTFQNIALFKGMTVLDNMMTGRITKMKANFLEQASSSVVRGARKWSTARRLRKSSISLKSSTSARPRSGACPMVCRNASNWLAHWRPSRRCCCLMSRWPA
jgi:ABC-type multidrug transport system fused ATPase/permease subunit